MNRIINISKLFVKNSFTKSISKKRNTFWQMIKSIIKLDYKPSWLLVITLLSAVAYLIAPFSLFDQQHILLRFADDVLLILFVLKVLSHETLRYSRFKARSRRVYP
ncbi:MAG: hypothetical protein QM530_01610 [Phycisphaerales bacterium]|nr:hypothetical protein [Phycisphaerales bacterium]